MNVLVTGSSGHIGGAIARGLADAGHAVCGLSRSRSEALPEGIHQHIFDIGDDAFVDEARSAISSCDTIVHAAACLESGASASSITRTNCWGTQQVLRLARQWAVKRFVFISGAAVIGTPTDHPITEEHPAQPLTAYTASKLFGEHLVAVFARETACGASLRVSSPIGPGMRADRIFAVFVERALEGKPLIVHGNGGRRQDYVDVRDLAQAVDRCLSTGPTGVFNLGSGVPVSNRELAEEVVRTLNSPSEVRFEGEPGPDETLCWDLATTKANRAFGYAPLHTLRDSIQAVADGRAARK